VRTTQMVVGLAAVPSRRRDLILSSSAVPILLSSSLATRSSAPLPLVIQACVDYVGAWTQRISGEVQGGSAVLPVAPDSASCRAYVMLVTLHSFGDTSRGFSEALPYGEPSSGM
jgi:hypothetical protein